jgi:hypothetical protein
MTASHFEEGPITHLKSKNLWETKAQSKPFLFRLSYLDPSFNVSCGGKWYRYFLHSPNFGEQSKTTSWFVPVETENSPEMEDS